ncbi:hypothetical protein [Streptomyces vinaceus]|uniref:hypothetical protein n=1 Tax=Streptomyces vinaceus TaxID=1960 RepID=UPI00380DB9D4
MIHSPRFHFRYTGYRHIGFNRGIAACVSDVFGGIQALSQIAKAHTRRSEALISLAIIYLMSRRLPRENHAELARHTARPGKPER